MIPLLVHLIRDLGFELLQKFLLELKFKPRVEKPDESGSEADKSSEKSKEDDKSKSEEKDDASAAE